MTIGTLRLLVFFALTAGVLVFLVIVSRIRMMRRAKALLQAMPNHERTTVYVTFSYTSAKGKQQEMDARISEMAKDGWVFLKAGEANPLRTLLSWGGGLNMHFIRNASDRV